MTKPNELPEWATNENYSGGPDVGAPTKVDPGAGAAAEGHVPGTRGAAQVMNWWQNLVGRWAVWLDGTFGDDGTTLDVLRRTLHLDPGNGSSVQADAGGDAAGIDIASNGTDNGYVQVSGLDALVSLLGIDGASVRLRGPVAREIIGESGIMTPAPIDIPNGLVIGDGVGHAPQYTYLGTQVFTTSGTWTRPAGCRAVKVTCVGGGQNAPSVSAGVDLVRLGSGGGGGGTAIAWGEGPEESYTVTVGGAGVAGGVSRVGTMSVTLCAASGGANGQGGVGTNGDILIRGGDGGPGCEIPGTMATGGLILVSGAGGGTTHGGGPRGRASSDGNPITDHGNDARSGAYGAGGGGAVARDSSATGGAGHDGVVIVEAYA